MVKTIEYVCKDCDTVFSFEIDFVSVLELPQVNCDKCNSPNVVLYSLEEKYIRSKRILDNRKYIKKIQDEEEALQKGTVYDQILHLRKRNGNKEVSEKDLKRIYCARNIEYPRPKVIITSHKGIRNFDYVKTMLFNSSNLFLDFFNELDFETVQKISSFPYYRMIHEDNMIKIIENYFENFENSNLELIYKEYISTFTTKRYSELSTNDRVYHDYILTKLTEQSIKKLNISMYNELKIIQPKISVYTVLHSIIHSSSDNNTFLKALNILIADFNLDLKKIHYYALGSSPLSLAIAYNKFDIASELIRNGASVHQRNPRFETTILMMCSQKKNIDIKLIRKVLTYGANINEVDMYYNTALHYACLTKRTDVILLLLEYNADANIPNIYRVKASSYMAKQGLL